MKVTSKKNCFCFTCSKAYHYLGIARHRALHRDRGEDCKISFTDGRVETYLYYKPTKMLQKKTLTNSD